MAKRTGLRAKRGRRIAWGESADVYLYPKGRFPFGVRVRRVERRSKGKKMDIPARSTYRTFFETKLAHLLFPENVINLVGLKPPKGGRVPEYYSKYYPLPKKAGKDILRMRELIRLAHARKVPKEDVWEAVRKFDRKMRRMFPELIPTAKALEEAGFIVPHPEINFTLHNGKIMFFEVFAGKKVRVGSRGQGIQDRPRVILPMHLQRLEQIAKQIPREKARLLAAETIKGICKLNMAGDYSKSLQGDAYDAIENALGNLVDDGVLNNGESAAILKKIGALVWEKIGPKEARKTIASISLAPK